MRGEWDLSFRAGNLAECLRAAVVAATVTVGCSGPPTAGQSVTVTRSALTSTTDVFGFENPADWSTSTAGAVLAQSTTHSQGSFSLQVTPSNSNGFTPIVSMPLANLAGVSPTLAWDVMLPTQQPNPNWFGTAQMYLNCPSRNIYSQFLGQVELTGMPLNVWNTVSFPLTNAEVTGLLQAGYSDLAITVVLNVAVPTTGVYFIDNLRFIPAAANACGEWPDGTSCTDGNACTQTDTCQAGVCVGGTAALFGVPESDPDAAKCPDGTAPVGCLGFDCNTGLSEGWLATPACSQSVSCIASCPATGCVPQNQRGGTVVQCDCSCADPTGGTPLSLSVQACGSSTTSCADLCAQASQSCSTGNCIVGACAPVAEASPETVLGGSCRSSDNGVVTVIAPYTGAFDPTSSRVMANIGGNTIASTVTGTVGFSSGVVTPGTFALTSLQAQVVGPIQFFGRRIDALQVNLRRPLFAAEQPGESGFKQFTLAVHPDDLAAQVVIGGVAQFLSLDAVGSLTGALSSDGSVLTLSGSQTQPNGDSLSMDLTAVTSNTPPQPTITVVPGTTLECTGNRAASATFNATVVDPDSGDSIKRIQWFVRDEGIGHGDTPLVPLGAGSAVTASLPLGPQQVSAVAYDQHEAAGQSTVFVQVRDTVAPVVTAPPDQTFYAGVGGTSVEVNLGNANVQEACDPRPLVSVVTSLDPDSPLRGAPIPNPGDVVLPVGQIPIIWTVTDVAGNTVSATQTVTVQAQDPPTGTPPPAPITIPAPTCTGGAMPVSPPNSPQVSIDLNVCIVGRINSGVKEGAAPWESCQGQDDSCTDTAIQALLAPANSIFSGFVNFNYKGFKRVADPYPPAADGSEPNDPCGTDGDGIYGYGDACIHVGLNNDNGVEINKMLSDCYAMWGYPLPNSGTAGEADLCQRPVTLLLVRAADALSQDPSVCGAGTPALDSAASTSVCMDPRTLANNTSGAFAFAATEGAGNPADNDCEGNVPLLIAHELGHTLGLGHGDGLDDDCDGVWDNANGILCDASEPETGPATLMNANGNNVTSLVTPLQQDRARIFATKSVQAGTSSTNSCPSTPVPAGPVDSKPPFAGCACRVGGSPGSMWAVGVIGLAIALRRRPRRRTVKRRTLTARRTDR